MNTWETRNRFEFELILVSKVMSYSWTFQIADSKWLKGKSKGSGSELQAEITRNFK